MYKLLLCLIYGSIEIVAVAWIIEALHNGKALGFTVAYLVAINLVAFAFYVYDKRLADLLDALHLSKVVCLRVPTEIMTWGLAFPGGWFGAGFGMAVADHKTGQNEKAKKFRQALFIAFLSNVILSVLALIGAHQRLVSLEQTDAVVERLVSLVMSVFRAAVEAIRALLG